MVSDLRLRGLGLAVRYTAPRQVLTECWRPSRHRLVWPTIYSVVLFLKGLELLCMGYCANRGEIEVGSRHSATTV